MSLLETQILKNNQKDFAAGPLVKNSPAKAEDRGSIPGLGRLQLPHALQ